MREEWRPIRNYEGLYEVSNMGNVKSLERTVWDSVRGYYRTVHERILKGRDSGQGYQKVQLCKDGKIKNYFVHQLVATAFCENQEGYTEVNHLDENPKNNCADNLEFCSRKYNVNYGTRTERQAEKIRGKKQSEETIKKRVEKLGKPVLAIHKINGLILEFPSAHEASRVLRINQGSITRCCQGKQMTAKGYTFFYANANDADAE